MWAQTLTFRLSREVSKLMNNASTKFDFQTIKRGKFKIIENISTLCTVPYIHSVQTIWIHFYIVAVHYPYLPLMQTSQAVPQLVQCLVRQEVQEDQNLPCHLCCPEKLNTQQFFTGWATHAQVSYADFTSLKTHKMILHWLSTRPSLLHWLYQPENTQNDSSLT